MLCLRPDGEPEGTLRVDEGSDSSEDERPPRNTVGQVPLQWYHDELHIGYDHDAKKLIKRDRKDKLDTLLAQTDTKEGLRTIYDEYNDEEIVLSKDELRMIQRIRQGQFPDVEVTCLIALTLFACNQAAGHAGTAPLHLTFTTMLQLLQMAFESMCWAD